MCKRVFLAKAMAKFGQNYNFLFERPNKLFDNEERRFAVDLTPLEL